MAGKTISQRISLEGSEDIRKALEALGDAGAKAFKQIQDAAKKPVLDPAQFAGSKQAIDQLVKSGSELARQFLALADQVKQFGAASSQAAGSVDRLAGANDNLAGSTKQAGTALKQAEVSTGSFLGTLGRITAAVGIVGAALTAAGTAAFAFAKNMATSVNEIVKSAEASKQSAQSFQQLNFALQQMGLGPKEAEEAIKALGETTKKAAAEGAAALQQFGFRFAPAADGAEALAKQLERLPVIVGSIRTFFPAATGDEERIKRITDVLKQFELELPKTAEQAKNLADVMLGLTETERSQKILLAFRDTLRVLGAEFPSTAEGSEKLQATLLKMGQGLSAAQSGSKKAGNALAALTPLLLQGQAAAKSFAEGQDQGIQQLARFAEGLSKIKDPATQAALAQAAFGKELGDKLLPTLRKGGAEILKFADDFKRLGLGLTGANIENAKKFEEAINNLMLALTRFGAVTAKGKISFGSLLQPTFTPLIVAATKAVNDYTTATAGAESSLVAFGKALATGIEPAIRVLIAVGTQLAGIWRDILVPAGQQLVGVIRAVASQFQDISTSQVVAIFITAAAAALGLATALKVIGLALTPFAFLISTLFSPLGLVLVAIGAAVVAFWDKFKNAANAALALIPKEVEGIKQAFQALLKGDFSTFWEKFSQAAISALQTIGKAISESEGIVGDFIRAITGKGEVKSPLIKELVDEIKAIGKELPAALLLIAAGFLALRKAAAPVAAVLSKIFGREISATGAILLAIIGSMSGAFVALAAVATVIGVAFSIIVGTITTLAALFGGPLTIAILGVTAAIVALIAFWPELMAAAQAAWQGIKAGAQAAIDFIKAWVTTPIANAWQWIITTFNAVVAGIPTALNTVVNAIATFVTTAVGGAWQWIVTTFTTVVGQIPALAQSAFAAVTSLVTTPIANAWQWIIDTFRSVISQLGLGGGAAGGQVGGRAGGRAAGGLIGGFQGGGLLGGRGTGTSDSNLIRVSRGEYIVPARAVRAPGVLAFLEALRHSGGRLHDIIDDMGRFALGGLVPRTIPAFATGGLAGGSMSNVTIQFPGLPPIEGLRASEKVIDELRKTAALAQVRSGGRKPSRYT